MHIPKITFGEMNMMVRTATLIFAIAFIASPTDAQSTECQTFGNQTYCNSSAQGAGLDATQQAQQALDRQSAQVAASERADAEHQAEAYNQVGALIAKGDCDAAKRLAAFYDRRSLTKATARACP